MEYSERQKENRRKANIAFHARNPDYKRKYNKKYKTEHEEETIEYNRVYFKTPNGKASVKRYQQSRLGRMAKSEVYKKRRSKAWEKINDAVRSGIRLSLKGKKHGRQWESLVGYTLQELMDYFENQFEDWMNWENYGVPKNGERTWNIDHIIPVSSFDFDSYEDEEFKKCWALSNLRPLCAIENMRKSNKIL